MLIIQFSYKLDILEIEKDFVWNLFPSVQYMAKCSYLFLKYGLINKEIDMYRSIYTIYIPIFLHYVTLVSKS